VKRGSTSGLDLRVEKEALKLGVDVKERKGGRFRIVGTWDVPPVEGTYWEREIFQAKWCEKL
jgi:hypothetical protein